MRREILLTLSVFDGTYQSMGEEEKVLSKCLPVSQRSIQRNASAKYGEMEVQLCPWRQKCIVARFGLYNFFYRRYTRADASIRQVAAGGGTIIAATDLRGFCGSSCIAPSPFHLLFRSLIRHFRPTFDKTMAITISFNLSYMSKKPILADHMLGTGRLSVFAITQSHSSPLHLKPISLQAVDCQVNLQLIQYVHPSIHSIVSFDIYANSCPKSITLHPNPFFKVQSPLPIFFPLAPDSFAADAATPVTISPLLLLWLSMVERQIPILSTRTLLYLMSDPSSS